ncbi:SUMO-activating enzyme subunit 2-like [Oncorhynchus nerka]|uniref:SUMO-activating enzyme subunit 2-like n=1 Tax=Oncorhynchus nerka TaxID=8023 RepID=UPI0011314611|nr:SUMO-activating enzyme subunit 2-like [Oncorhynchus nerka]
MIMHHSLLIANNSKFLSDFGIRHGSRLQVDDFLQDYTLLVNVIHCEDLEKDVEFEVVGDAPDKAPTPPSVQEDKNVANGNKDCRTVHLFQSPC